MLQAGQTYGYKGARDAEKLVADISALFAGDELSEDAKGGIMCALQEAYWIAKEKNRERYISKNIENINDFCKGEIMELEYIDHTNAVSNEKLLEDLVRVSKIIGSPKITIDVYDSYGKYNSSTVSRHFGTWNKALELSGLQASNKYYTVQELYDNLAEIWLKLGRQPTRRDLSTAQSPISYKAYERKFGKWSTALKSFVEYYNSGSELSSDVIPNEPQTSVHKTSRDINLRLRFLVMRRDNFRCCICGASPANDPSVILHVDHIIPWAKGGETVVDNLQTLCSKCNLGKSDL